MFHLSFKNRDKKVYCIMIRGLQFSFILLIVALYILLLYNFYPVSHVLFHSGLLLFKASLTFAISFYIFAIVMDTFLKNI